MDCFSAREQPRRVFKQNRSGLLYDKPCGWSASFKACHLGLTETTDNPNGAENSSLESTERLFMITSTYHVFGSGSAALCWSGTAEAIVKFVAETHDKWENDGDNGFVGTKSCPDDLVPEGISTLDVYWPPAHDDYEAPEGYRGLGAVKAEYASVKWGVSKTMAAAIIGGFSSLSCKQILQMTIAEAGATVGSSWLKSQAVVELVCRGEPLPPEVVLTTGASTAGLYGMIQEAYRNGVNPLPFLRKLFPTFNWEFYSNSSSAPASTERGVYPVYSPGDVVFRVDVSYGIVTGTLAGTER